jgi:hypothetical protein
VGKRKLPVIIQSPGGDVDAALAMGRLIRANKLDVAVGYTTFSSCAPRQKKCDAAKTGYTGIAAIGFAYCNSACPLVLAGGTRRLVGTWGHLGVHQVTTTMVKEKILYKTTTRVVNGKKVVKKKVVSRKRTGSYETTKMSKALRRKLETYLAEMGVSADLLEPINKTPASELLRLDQSHMLALKLITSMDQLEVLTSLTICKADPAPANCRVDQTAVAKAKDEEKAAAKTADSPSPVQVIAIKPAKAPITAPSNPPTAATYMFRPEKVQPTNTSPMRLVVVRGSSPLCDPNCPEWISAEGVITGRTPKLLAELLQTIGDRRLPIIISSSGGDVYGAAAAGRLIRKHQLDTAVGKTRFINCAPEDPNCSAEGGMYVGAAIAYWGECDEECTLMLAGGVRRFAGPWAKVFVRAPAVEQSVGRYLDEMAIGPGLLSLMMSAQAHWVQIEPAAMLETGLITGLEEADVLMGSTICKSVPQPSNCRDVTASQ